MPLIIGDITKTRIVPKMLRTNATPTSPSPKIYKAAISTSFPSVEEISKILDTHLFVGILYVSNRNIGNTTDSEADEATSNTSDDPWHALRMLLGKKLASNRLITYLSRSQSI